MTAESGPRTRITTAVVRELMSDPKIFAGLPPDMDDDAEFTLDSMGMVWFLHQLELRYGVVIELEEAHFTGFTSIRRITEYVAGVDEP